MLKALGLLFCFMVLMPIQVKASQIWCNGTIVGTYVDSTGNLFIHPSWTANWIDLCNINTGNASISVQTCLAWYGMVQTAYKGKTPTTTSYSSGACSTMPAYTFNP